MSISWDFFLHADEVLLFVWLVVWFIRFIIGVVTRTPGQTNTTP
jgi:hypothetical protein